MDKGDLGLRPKIAFCFILGESFLESISLLVMVMISLAMDIVVDAKKELV